MNHGAISVIYLALSAVVLIGLYGVYQPQINATAGNTFDRVESFTDNGFKMPTHILFTDGDKVVGSANVKGSTLTAPSGYTFPNGKNSEPTPANLKSGAKIAVNKIQPIDPSDPSDTNPNQPDKWGVTPAQWKKGVAVTYCFYTTSYNGGTGYKDTRLECPVYFHSIQDATKYYRSYDVIGDDWSRGYPVSRNFGILGNSDMSPIVEARPGAVDGTFGGSTRIGIFTQNESRHTLSVYNDSNVMIFDKC